MSNMEIERRLLRLETELSQLKDRPAEEPTKKAGRCWEEIAGSFANDSIHVEAMRLGRAYRKRQCSPARQTRQTDRQ
jgi:hypothetical protein